MKYDYLHDLARVTHETAMERSTPMAMVPASQPQFGFEIGDITSPSTWSPTAKYVVGGAVAVLALNYLNPPFVRKFKRMF